MISGHYFKRIRKRPAVPKTHVRPGKSALLVLLEQHIVERFNRRSGAGIPAVVIALSQLEEEEDPPPNPCHPACGEYANTDYCRESWQLHLAELESKPETHWHKCDHDRFCAVVPVVCRSRCLAAVKLACPTSMSEEDFEWQVKILDLLVSDFVRREGSALDKLLLDRPASKAPGKPSSSATSKLAAGRPKSQQVVRALEYIKSHLAEPGLAVAQIARDLEAHPRHLSRLFTTQVGRRMSQFIMDRRIDLAKSLLATTGWQIKQIASETGHANPNWFCHVFRTHTGLTPGGYRRKTQPHHHS